MSEQKTMSNVVKEFKSQKDGSSVLFYAKGEEHFYKHTKKGQWLKRAEAVGPFKNQGDALLAACMSKDFKFSEFGEVQR